LFASFYKDLARFSRAREKKNSRRSRFVCWVEEHPQTYTSGFNSHLPYSLPRKNTLDLELIFVVFAGVVVVVVPVVA
jgi:hypothetical protein